MRHVYSGAVLLVAVAVMAGCTLRGGIREEAERPGASPQAAAAPEGAKEESVNPVRFLNLGAQAVAGRPMEVVWEVKPAGGEKTIAHTAVHFDRVSHPGDFGLTVTPAAAGYKELTPEFAKGEVKIPRAFTATLTPVAGTLYLRAHAIVDGKNYWTAEEQIEVVASVEDVGSGDTIMKKPEGTIIKKEGEGAMLKPEKPVVKSFTMTAKSWEFSPSTITVKKGDLVKLMITSTDVIHGFGLPDFGLDRQLDPGKTATVEFTADKVGEFMFRCSRWCGAGHPTMTGTLIVQE